MEKPFELTDLITKKELELIMANLSGCVKMSCGIVRHPVTKRIDVVGEFNDNMIYSESYHKDYNILAEVSHVIEITNNGTNTRRNNQNC